MISEFIKHYFVDEKGCCYSDKSGKLTKLNLFSSGKGYVVVKPYFDGKNKNMYVHRLVAEAFIDKVDGKRFVNHIDGNKSNNHYSNLEWVTHSENMKHASETGLMKNNKRSKSVIGFTSGGIGTWYPSVREAERNGFTSECISRVCLGKSKTHKGMVWEHCND